MRRDVVAFLILNQFHLKSLLRTKRLKTCSFLYLVLLTFPSNQVPFFCMQGVPFDYLQHPMLGQGMKPRSLFHLGAR